MEMGDRMKPIFLMFSLFKMKMVLFILEIKLTFGLSWTRQIKNLEKTQKLTKTLVKTHYKYSQITYDLRNSQLNKFYEYLLRLTIMFFIECFTGNPPT